MSSINLKVSLNNYEYPIIIGSDIAHKLSRILKKHDIKFNKCLLVIDKKVPKYQIRNITKSINKKKIIFHFFNAKEKNKNQSSINNILEILQKNNFNRNDCLISIGGGITGDVSGFASSIFKRGIKFINIPTTLLAQVDSSIGGKTGINSKYGKNLIGSFYQPSLVLSDTNFLKSLPKREIICGYGEILKHSLINDRNFFLYLNKHGSKILKLQNPFIQKAIYKSCLIKKKIVEIDEKENGLRKILNFGHTFAHAFEASLNYSKKINHGEAVLLGVKTASRFSLDKNLLPLKEFNMINDHLNLLNLPAEIKKFFTIKKVNNLISFMKIDKKNNTKKINLVLLKKIGKPIFNLNFNSKKLVLFLKKELTN